MKRAKLMLAVLLGVVLIIAGCSSKANESKPSESASNNGSSASSAAPSNDGPVKFGVVMPVTGPSALYGNQTINGSKLAAKWINDDGGILGGRQVELLVEDDQSTPEVGVKAYTKLMERDKVHVLTGGANSSVSMAIVGLAENKMLNMLTTAKAPDVMNNRDPFRFRLNSTNTMDGELYHTFIADVLKPKSVAVIVENTDYGQAEIKALQENWKDGGPELTQIEYFELTETDYTNILTKLKNSNADALYVAGSTIEINSAIFNQANQLGIQDVVKLLASGQLNSTFVELAGEAAEGVISADVYMSAINNDFNARFTEAFEKEFDYKPGKMELLGFEAIWLPAQAMNQVGSDSNYDEISKVLENNVWETPRGLVKFIDGQALGEVSILTVKNGEITTYQ